MPRERFVDVIEERPVVGQYAGPVVSWGGALAGLFVGAGVVLLLGVLGLAIGTTLVIDRMGIAASMWAGLTILIGFFVAGLVAGRAINQSDRAGALIQGTLVWILGVLTVAALAVSGIGAGARGLLEGLNLGTLATPTVTSRDDAARALEDLRARVAPLRDDAARVAAEVQAFFAQHPERPPVPDTAAAAVQRNTRLGGWITLGALLLTLLVAVGGALTGSPDPAYD